MTPDILSILANAGSAGIVGLMFIAYLYFDSKKKRQTLIIKDDERKDDTDHVSAELKRENYEEGKRIDRVDTLFEEHCKVQGETLSLIHNGLNSNAKAVLDLSKELSFFKTEVLKEITKLATIIEERIPKK